MYIDILRRTIHTHVYINVCTAKGGLAASLRGTGGRVHE